MNTNNQEYGFQIISFIPLGFYIEVCDSSCFDYEYTRGSIKNRVVKSGL